MEFIKITLEEWERKKEHGYTHFIDGVPYILTMGDNGGTVLAPVEVVDQEEEKGENKR